jgi:hypothetical protein
MNDTRDMADLHKRFEEKVIKIAKSMTTDRLRSAVIYLTHLNQGFYDSDVDYSDPNEELDEFDYELMAQADETLLSDDLYFTSQEDLLKEWGMTMEDIRRIAEDDESENYNILKSG